MRTIAIIFCLSVFCYSCADAPEENTTESTAPVEEAVEEPVEEVLAEQPEQTSNATIEDLTPAGYTLFKTFKGDLNRDEYEDMVLVYDAIDADDEMLNRAVMLATADAEGNLTRAALNKDGAFCSECGGMMGDPFVQVVIKNGYFTIEHLGGSRTKWTNDPTFKYNEEDGKWYLHQHSEQVHDGLDPENGSSTTIRTTKDFGVVAFEDFTY